MKKVNLLFGTVYGSAQSVAEVLHRSLEQLGYEARLWQMHELDGFVPPTDELLLLICATTGQGDIPDELQPWFTQMQSQAPWLPELNYAIVALGDSSYDTFCGAGLQLESLLNELGCRALLPMLKIDAMETMTPDLLALQWLKSWHEQAEILPA